MSKRDAQLSVRKFIYRPTADLPVDLEPSQTLEVRIPAHFLSSSNPGVEGRWLWGTDVYTEDSDLVAVLQHCGYMRPAKTAPQNFNELVVSVKLSPHSRTTSFPGSDRNYIRSRFWGEQYDRRCLEILNAWTLSGVKQANKVQLWPSRLAFSQRGCNAALVPGPVDPFSSRPFMFNLSGEMVTPYSVVAVADTRHSASEWLTSLLATHVLVLETDSGRYELSQIKSTETKDAELQGDVYRLRRSLRTAMFPVFDDTSQFPLSDGDAEDVCDDLSWDEVRWSPQGLSARDMLLVLVNVAMVRRKDAPGADSDSRTTAAPGDGVAAAGEADVADTVGDAEEDADEDADDDMEDEAGEAADTLKTVSQTKAENKSTGATSDDNAEYENGTEPEADNEPHVEAEPHAEDDADGEMSAPALPSEREAGGDDDDENADDEHDEDVDEVAATAERTVHTTEDDDDNEEHGDDDEDGEMEVDGEDGEEEAEADDEVEAEEGGTSEGGAGAVAAASVAPSDARKPDHATAGRRGVDRGGDSESEAHDEPGADTEMETNGEEEAIDGAATGSDQPDSNDDGALEEAGSSADHAEVPSAGAGGSNRGTGSEGGSRAANGGAEEQSGDDGVAEPVSSNAPRNKRKRSPPSEDSKSRIRRLDAGQDELEVGAGSSQEKALATERASPPASSSGNAAPADRYGEGDGDPDDHAKAQDEVSGGPSREPEREGAPRTLQPQHESPASGDTGGEGNPRGAPSGPVGGRQDSEEAKGLPERRRDPVATGSPPSHTGGEAEGADEPVAEG